MIEMLERLLQTMCQMWTQEMCNSEFKNTFLSFYDSKEPRVEERPRPITVSDLEARPGSPSIVIVPGSRSSEDEISPKLKTGKPGLFIFFFF